MWGLNFTVIRFGLDEFTPFTFSALRVVLAARFLREHATRGQWLGLAVAAVGVLLIARSVDGTTNVFAIGLALLSALTWAIGNLFFRTARGVSMFAVTAWACVLPPLPLALIALIFERPDQLLAPILAPSWKGWVALFYTVVPVMWLGYLIWGTLLRTYPAAKVGPISLLVPCVALGFAGWLVGEPLGGLRLLGVIVVLGGVATGVFASVRRVG